MAAYREIKMSLDTRLLAKGSSHLNQRQPPTAG